MFFLNPLVELKYPHQASIITITACVMDLLDLHPSLFLVDCNTGCSHLPVKDSRTLVTVGGTEIGQFKQSVGMVYLWDRNNIRDRKCCFLY